MRHFPAVVALLCLSRCHQVSNSTGGPQTASAAVRPSVGKTQAPSPTDVFHAWLDKKYEEELQFSPMRMTFLGRKDKYDQLDDFTVAGEERRLQWRKQTVEEMKARFDYAALPSESQLSYDLWTYLYELEAAGAPFRYSQYVFDQMMGPQNFLPTFLIAFHRVDNKADMLAYVARIADIGRAFDELLDRARESSRRGVQTPAFALEGVIEQAKAVIAGQPFSGHEDSALWADIQSEIATLRDNAGLSAEEAESLRTQARTALQTGLKPAYERLIAWANDELKRAPAFASGVGSQPNGKAYYAYQLHYATTTHMTADEIHEFGLAEVARIREELVAVKNRVGFKQDLNAFFQRIRSDVQNYYPNTDKGRQAYLDDARTVIDNIRKHLPDYFGILPRADLIVRRVEPFREQDGAAQHYFPATPDGSRPGIYYAHLSDMTAMPKNQLEVIAYHEGIPGHHMQISIAQERADLPRFRAQAEFTAYQEGWALYAERLAKEIPGTYKDPYSEVGQLTSELWRAIRLVVDTGLHDRAWGEERAIAYFMANSPEPEESVRSEVRRYLVWPGQATSYKIGMKKILELRRKAEATLGPAFDIKGYHDAVLGGGAMPLSILERRIDSWIDRLKHQRLGPEAQFSRAGHRLEPAH